jgi:hypothetical protein
MKHLILAAALLLPGTAFAQQPPPPIPVAPDTLQHAIEYMQRGGTHSEGAMIAHDLLRQAQAYVAQQQGVAKVKVPPEANLSTLDAPSDGPK